MALVLADGTGVLVPLSQGLFAVVDREDYDKVKNFAWCAKRSRGKYYAARTGRHGETIYMHTLLTGYGVTDHQDGDGLNDRRSNLREVTNAQNQANRLSMGGASKYKGVYWERRTQKWYAHEKWSEGGRRHTRSLGHYASEEEAARAYDAAARARWGEFAALNFPEPGERSALAA